MSDAVKHPDHYTWHPLTMQLGIECHHVAEEFSYNVGVAMAYLWRAGRKPGAEAIEDMQKAIQHLEFEVTRLECHGNR